MKPKPKGEPPLPQSEHPKGEWSIQRDAAMRMHSEAAKLVVCPECGCARGRHLGACSRG